MILNLTVTSRGRQFDRLASLYLGDNEIFRTSTAEPTKNGIRWTYSKDVSAYLSLFKVAQKVIFDLGNLINEKYTGPFNVTLTALFFNNTIPTDAAELILPISARRSEHNKPSSFFLPDDRANNKIKFPKNARRAVVSLLATGQAKEEFWYANVLNSDRDAFPPNPDPLPGYSPFREVQLWINGSLAGVVSPYPVIFTGGFCPALWRPVVGIDAFDLREGEIDITPWLPLLSYQAKEGFDFEIRVVGIDNDGKGNATLSKSVGNYWVVTGNIFIWMDEPYRWTSGSRLSYSAPDPTIEVSSNKFGDGIYYSVLLHREFHISSVIVTSEGEQLSTWSQNIRTEINGDVFDDGNSQSIYFDTLGFDTASGGYGSRYHYDAYVEVDVIQDEDTEGIYMEGLIDRGLSMQSHGPSVHPAAPASLTVHASTRKASSSFSSTELKTRQGGDFTMEMSHGNITFASAATDQGLLYMAVDAAPNSEEELQRAPTLVEKYRRRVLAHNGVLLKDEETLRDDFSDDDIPAVRANMAEQPAKLEVSDFLGRLPLTMGMSSRLAFTEQRQSETKTGWLTRCWNWLRRA